MDRLYRDLAPIPDAAWIEIEKTARHVLETNLGARHYVDVVGPRGPEYAAVDLGRLEDDAANVRQGVHWGVRRVSAWRASIPMPAKAGCSAARRSSPSFPPSRRRAAKALTPAVRSRQTPCSCGPARAMAGLATSTWWWRCTTTRA